jgi:hypothetical protein
LPVRTRNPDKSKDEDLKAAQAGPAGSQTFRLVDAAFDLRDVPVRKGSERGTGETFNGQRSIVICHLRYALRADLFPYKEMPREAHPQMTNDN